VEADKLQTTHTRGIAPRLLTASFLTSLPAAGEVGRSAAAHGFDSANSLYMQEWEKMVKNEKDCVYPCRFLLRLLEFFGSNSKHI
jgi:hypothetical protein